ncbi:hypothetical protein ACFYRY_42095 [Streptomyces sp. NPDC005263]|uniref:hypothetical protein n=1 Tax=Streptomyces sp. NPDC005263 TaxID=3364711 RepID=UPI00368F5C20
MSEEPEQPNPFEGMDRAGFQAYIKHTYVKEGKPKYQEIIDQAAACDAKVTLTTSTISATFKGRTYPKLDTAVAIGLGLGGPELAADFEMAWREAWENHRRNVHRQSMDEAKRAMRREAAKEERRRKQRDAAPYPLWWPEHPLLRGQHLQALALGVVTVLLLLWNLLRDFSLWPY